MTIEGQLVSGIGRPIPNDDSTALAGYATEPKENATYLMEKRLELMTRSCQCETTHGTMSPPTNGNGDMV
jgi:hypothetical protein